MSNPPLSPLPPLLTDEDGEVRQLTEDDFKGMRPLREVDPGMVAAVAAWREELAAKNTPPLTGPPVIVTTKSK